MDKALKKYGTRTCLCAYLMNHLDGEGASTIGFTLGMTTRQADAAIDAGRRLCLAAWECGLLPIGLDAFLRTLPRATT